MRVLAFALLLLALLLWMAARSVYFPLRYPGGDWAAKERLGAADVFPRASDGVRLHAWFAGSAAAPWATLHLHGNAGNISYRSAAARDILAAGSAVLLLEYRGYGRSEGRPSERGLYRDADAGYAYLREAGFAPERIVIYGESLGTAVAVDLASREPCGGMVLEAPFPSARAVAHRMLPFLGPLLTWGFDTNAKITAVHAPLLVFTGERDEVIAPGLQQRVFDRANEPKHLVRLAGAGHNDMHASGELARRLKAFYAGLRP